MKRNSMLFVHIEFSSSDFKREKFCINPMKNFFKKMCVHLNLELANCNCVCAHTRVRVRKLLGLLIFTCKWCTHILQSILKSVCNKFKISRDILKEISPGISLEGMMLKLQLQYFGHLMRRADSLEKTLMLEIGRASCRERV